MKLDEIKARLQAASPGPWDNLKGPGTNNLWGIRCRNNSKRDTNWKDWICLISLMPVVEQADKNAEFIAHAPTDIAQLISALEIAMEALEKLQYRADVILAPTVGHMDSHLIGVCREIFDPKDGSILTLSRFASETLEKIRGER